MTSPVCMPRVRSPTVIPDQLPLGFHATVANIGVKDTTDDFVVITMDGPAMAATGVFTQSRFAGPSVVLSRQHLATGTPRAMVVVSKNANVANGPEGISDADRLVATVADRWGYAPSDILLASTGVIGRRYPIDTMIRAVAQLDPGATSHGLRAAARGIMTTDTVEKVAVATIGEGPAVVCGIAKGVGMIEPDMATMIAVVMTDAALPVSDLRAIHRRVTNTTFNCVSVDTDTSTSDTAVLLASGHHPVDPADMERALADVQGALTRAIAADGEGAETLIEVHVDGARDDDQAKRVAKSIVNSPLVKTAIHGADPNWGRVAMAIGKCNDHDIDADACVISFGGVQVYPRKVDDAGLAELENYLRGPEVTIEVDLHIDRVTATVWGCDLTDGYIRINADYTT